jgi:hypothetical protein
VVTTWGVERWNRSWDVVCEREMCIIFAITHLYMFARSSACSHTRIDDGQRYDIMSSSCIFRSMRAGIVGRKSSWSLLLSLAPAPCYFYYFLSRIRAIRASPPGVCLVWRVLPLLRYNDQANGLGALLWMRPDAVGVMCIVVNRSRGRPRPETSPFFVLLQTVSCSCSYF